MPFFRPAFPLPARLLALGCIAASLSPAAHADEGGRLSLMLGPYAYHWSDAEEHKHVYLLGLEQKRQDDSLIGAALFRNSFGQPSAYVYYGHQWDHVLGQAPLFAKLSGGVIYGYKGQYQDKVPFNHHGFGLAVIPAVGWQFTPEDAAEVGILGSAALIFTYNRSF
ncbi:ABC transporter ATP-binding protein [Xylophilus rhododendri]|uniref:ABC transporter ATP-binding protein n=1 Tax=Xylophilus rhododendri TaxID=2697032 RepID=A0A857J8Y0_9BURK|nr:ABC transporter ATP-binding protein [Xylophilus rhododendri]QHJ00337.1 ABC transporter ATP-binding protein [Xylophilus rhododendri]